MVRYGKEQRDGAVGLYIRYERCAVDVIHELGYPGRGMLPVLAGSKEAHVTETSGEKPPTAGEGGGGKPARSSCARRSRTADAAAGTSASIWSWKAWASGYPPDGSCG